MNDILKLYIVQNKEGKYLRSIGYGGSGTNWVDDINKAKIYPKVGQAKSRITFFFKNWPEYGCPTLIEITTDLKAANRIDMEAETKKKIHKSEVKELQRKERSNRYRLESLQAQQSRLQNEIDTLKKNS